MKSSADVKQAISQVRREIADCERSMPAVVDRDDLEALYDAQESLRKRQGSLRVLEDYLPVVQEREAAAEKQAKRAKLEAERDAAKAEHDALDADFEKVMLPLEKFILDALPQLDEIAQKRREPHRQHSNAAFELRGRTDGLGKDDLSRAFGWFSVAAPSSDVRAALYELYAARHGLPGRLNLEGQEHPAHTAHRAWLVSGAGAGIARPAPVQQPNPAEQVQMPTPAAPAIDPNTASFAADLLGLQLDK